MGDGQARFLPVAELEVSREATGMAMARTLLDAQGLSVSDLALAYAGLFVGLPDTEDGWSALERVIPAIVTNTGVLEWQTHAPTVTLGDLQVTAASGLCARPEHGVAIILTGGSGGVDAVEWRHLVDLLQVAGTHLTYLGGLYGGAIAVRRLTKASGDVIARSLASVRRLAVRDSPPSAERLENLLDKAPECRHRVLSIGLELSDEETEDLLRLLGYVRPDLGANYTAAHDDVIKLAKLIYTHAKWSGVVDDDELADTSLELRQAIDRIVERISTGEAIPDKPDEIWAPPE